MLPTKLVNELVVPSKKSWSPSVAVPSECRCTALRRSMGAGSGRPGDDEVTATEDTELPTLRPTPTDMRKIPQIWSELVQR